MCKYFLPGMPPYLNIVLPCWRSLTNYFNLSNDYTDTSSAAARNQIIMHRLQLHPQSLLLYQLLLMARVAGRVAERVVVVRREARRESIMIPLRKKETMMMMRTAVVTKLATMRRARKRAKKNR